MTVKDFYDFINGDYAGTLSRLMKEERILKYVKKFAESDEFTQLKDNLAKQDYETAFRNAHNMKGVCANLGFSELQEVSSTLCEDLRPGFPSGDVEKELRDVADAYDRVIAAIALID